MSELVDGDWMLLSCVGGPSMLRAVHYPPPAELRVDDGMYVLVDDGDPSTWFYEYIDATMLR